MHEDGIVDSPERYVESDKLLLAEEVLCFLLSDDKLFLHKCSPCPLKDVSVEVEFVAGYPFTL